ncbi:MAG: hypothetical protein NVS3B12_19000 [Acidimicrobiales bacterium]
MKLQAAAPGGKTDIRVFLGLAGATVVIFVLAIAGALTIGHDNTKRVASSKKGGADVTAGGSSGGPSDTAAAPAPGASVPGTAGASAAPGPPGAAAGPGGRSVPGATTGSGGGLSSGVAPSGAALSNAPGATRLGLTSNTIKVGVHGPVTLDGAPLAIAADPIEGIKSYINAINQEGGVNGRMIALQIADDRYTVDGGKQAANQLVNDYKPFLISGTLGIDQIYQVASAAKGAGIPYMAAGGPENQTFRDLGMYQIAANYNTHLDRLAQFLGKETKKAGNPFFGKTKVGVSVLNSPYITPVVADFGKALAANGLKLVKTVTVEKPTSQTSYGTQLQELRDAGTQIFVPAQDPVTTSREVAECRSQGCTWLYSFSGFAHDGDTDLALMQGEWGKPGSEAEGLSSSCYYNAPNRDDPKQCGAMGKAHTIWVQQHAGNAGGGETDWNQHGSGGSAGYQVDHFFLKALRDGGADLTREKFVGALNAYNGYQDLVSGPITFLNSPNHMHGDTEMVVLKAQATQKYTQLTPGLVDQF